MKMQVVDYATFGGDFGVELGKGNFTWTRLWPASFGVPQYPKFLPRCGMNSGDGFAKARKDYWG